MPTNTPAPGTIPALPQYQPGALPITGQEIAEIASTPNATSAASYQINIAQFVGKVPSVLAAAAPASNDMVVFFQARSGLPFSATMGNLGVAAGNVPTGGSAGQILEKSSSTNYDASWSNLGGLVSASTSLFLTGSTTLAIGVATAGIGSAQIATNAVGNVQLRQGAGLSVVGVAANATANVADIAANAGNQFLQSNAAATGLLFTTLAITTAALPGPYQTGTLINFGALYGNGTTALGVTAAGTTGYLLTGNGTALAPSFQLLNLTASVTGSLPVINGGTNNTAFTAFGVVYANGSTQLADTAAGGAGLPLVSVNATAAPGFSILTLAGGGTGTTALTAHGVVIANATNALHVTATQTAGQLLVGQNVTTDPAWQTVVGDVTFGAAGTATITANTVTFAKFQQIAAGTLLGNPTNATANVTATTTPTLGFATATGGLILAGFTSGAVTVQPGSGVAGSYNFNLPTTIGTANYALVSGGTNTAAMNWTAVLTLIGTGQVFGGGTRLTAFSVGTLPSAGTTTLDSGNGPIQFCVNNGSSTIIAMANDGELDLLVTNSTNASTLTVQGFTAYLNTGDTYTTTNGTSFIFMARRINGKATYKWAGIG